TVASTPTSGLLSNTATVAPETGATDTNPVNNSATDDDGLAPVSGAIVVNGVNDDATLVINADSPNGGTYQVTTGGVPGPVVPFDHATSFTFNGTPESQETLETGGPNDHDTMIVNNPAGGLFAPPNGIF